MMPTTTIRIEDALKLRIAAVAERAGKTPHAFMLDAIAHALEQFEQDEAFDRVADQRRANILASGQTVPWDDAKAWIEARSRGNKADRPGPRNPGR
jgi:predicted transcriptional regulator